MRIGPGLIESDIASMKLIYLLSLFLTIILLFFFTVLYSRKFIVNFSAAPKANHILVLGAGLSKNGFPSKILADRLLTALKYADKFDPKFIILSGSVKGNNYNEPAVMRTFLIEKGVKDTRIIIDQVGFSTFESSVNFKNNFKNSDLIIISQKFHLFRSITISRLVGLTPVGLEADNYDYKNGMIGIWYLREFLAIPYNLLKLIKYNIQKIL